MSVDKINISETIARIEKSLSEEKGASAEFRGLVELLLVVVKLLVERRSRSSNNSSLPPSQDPNRKRGSKRKGKGKKRKPGGQPGHDGACLEQVEDPDFVETIEVDRKSIPPGRYKHAGYEVRQVIDVVVSREVTEYRAEVLENANGEQYVADFPEGVTSPVQYGNGVKVHSTYMSQHQLVPLLRVREHFRDQLEIELSKGSISNWNVELYRKLDPFETWARRDLINSVRNNGDETGINVDGKRLWLHTVSSEKTTLFHADEKRGQEAMDRMGILPFFKGVLMHDHWKAYFAYKCKHALCNAHHLRELEAAVEFDGQKWAKAMQDLLLEMKAAVEEEGGALSKKRANRFRKKYRRILRKAEKECPRNLKTRAQSKSRNLLERLRDFEKETLRFLRDRDVPFTNNLGENDIRMTKVQQKISGCFRSMDGARIFCRIRSYLITCRKRGISAGDALRMVFDGKLPSFIT
jgi:transposase